ncbi:MAG TPA: TonB-dependent receptor [Polyangiaceae bacterium]|nr:TonB-dependent receptor [Polyangiaceae bacterium]
MRSKPILAALLAGALLANAARAENTEELEELLEDPIVSTASKTAEASSVAPATTTTITAEELRRFGIRTLDEALNYLSLGMVTENPRWSVELGVRGVLLTHDYGSHVLLLVDGHAINEQWAGTAYYDRGAGVPFELIDHIEVILGPGSVLYGSNAMLGVVNIVTKRAKDFAGTRVIAESELLTSGRGAVGFGYELELFGQPAEIVGEVEYYSSRGPASEFGPQNYGEDSVTGEPKRFSSATPPTGIWSSEGQLNLFSMRAPAAYVRARVGDFELALRGATFNRWSPFAGGADLGSTEGFEREYWLSLDARYRKALAERVELSVRVYGDFYDYRESDPISAAEDCLEGQVTGCTYELLGGSRWLGTEVQTSFDWFKDGRFPTLLGADGRLSFSHGSGGEYVDAATGVSTLSAPSTEALEAGLGVFLQQTANFTNWFSMNAGLRVDLAERGDLGSSEARHELSSHSSPRVAAMLTPWRGGHFKAIYSEAFRSPAMYERYYYDPLAQVAAPDLRPETVQSVEGSFEQRFGAQRVRVAVFRTHLADLVVTGSLSDDAIEAAIADGRLSTTATSPISQYKNAASVGSSGVNVGFDGTSLSSRLFYGLGATSAYVRQDAGDGTPAARLPAAASFFGNARIGYDLRGKLPTIALAGRVAGKRPIVGTDFSPTPYASPLVELRATVSGIVPGVPSLSYRLAANTVLSDGNPYAIGPLTAPAPGYTRQETVPVDRFRVAIGFEYRLPF